MAIFINKKYNFLTEEGRNYIEDHYEEFASQFYNISCGEELFLNHLLDTVFLNFFKAKDMIAGSDTYCQGLELMRDTLEFVYSDRCERLLHCLGREDSFIPHKLLRTYSLEEIKDELDGYDIA